jgi:hypothetical protein
MLSGLWIMDVGPPQLDPRQAGMASGGDRIWDRNRASGRDRGELNLGVEKWVKARAVSRKRRACLPCTDKPWLI